MIIFGELIKCNYHLLCTARCTFKNVTIFIMFSHLRHVNRADLCDIVGVPAVS